jgi:hypothetical protein
MQMFDVDTGFSASASLSICQRIKRYWHNDNSPMCNTSNGYTVPYSGQHLRVHPDDENILIHMSRKTDIYHDIKTGEIIGFVERTLPDFDNIKRWSTQESQGFAHLGDKAAYAIFGTKGHDDIEVFNIKQKKKVYRVQYKDLSKKWWVNWEAQGINIDAHGNLWAGIAVKSNWRKLWRIVNYRLRISV